MQRCPGLECAPAQFDEPDRVVEPAGWLERLQVPMDLRALRRLARDHDRPDMIAYERNGDPGRVELVRLYSQARGRPRRGPLLCKPGEVRHRLHRNGLAWHFEDQRLDGALRVLPCCASVSNKYAYEALPAATRQRIDAELPQLRAITMRV